jgi:hypothetical protein
MKQIKVLSLCVVAVAAMLMATSYSVSSSIKAGDITGGKKAPHVNVAIFHKLHGQEDFSYPKHIADRDIIHAMQGKAQFISINHTAGLVDGDIITIGNDVLREGANSAFEDFGVDCQLNVHIKSDNVSLAGLCQVLMVDQSGREIEHKALIKPTTMEAGKNWVLLYDDTEDGIAVYADEEVGME